MEPADGVHPTQSRSQATTERDGVIADSPDLRPSRRGRKSGDAHKMNQAPIRGAVFDHGQIETIKLPDGWVESDEDYYSTVGTRSLRVFHPANSPDAVLCFYYRGLPIDAESGRNFLAVLSGPCHELKLQELASITEVLADKQNLGSFAAASARTENINDKRVLMVEGQYKKKDAQIMHMFIDADGSGRAVQEVYFQAPAGMFTKHEEQARAALRSIKWSDEP